MGTSDPSQQKPSLPLASTVYSPILILDFNYPSDMFLGNFGLSIKKSFLIPTFRLFSDTEFTFWEDCEMG
jgi:hypothetical protein